MVVGFEAHPGSPRPDPDALEREVPEMLRRRHQTPAHAGEARRRRAEISGGEHDQTVWLEVLGATLERVERIGKMLDNIKQQNDVGRAEAIEILVIGDTGENIQARATTMGRGILGKLNAGNFEPGLRFLEKETIGATDFNEPSGRAEAAHEFDFALELRAQDGLGGEVVGISIGVPTGKISLRIVARRIEPDRVGAAEATRAAPQDVATVFSNKSVCRVVAAQAGQCRS